MNLPHGLNCKLLKSVTILFEIYKHFKREYKPYELIKDSRNPTVWIVILSYYEWTTLIRQILMK